MAGRLLPAGPIAWSTAPALTGPERETNLRLPEFSANVTPVTSARSAGRKDQYVYFWRTAVRIVVPEFGRVTKGHTLEYIGLTSLAQASIRSVRGHQGPVGIAALGVAREGPDICHRGDFTRVSVDHLTLGVASHVNLFRDELDGDESGFILQFRLDDFSLRDADKRAFERLVVVGTDFDRAGEVLEDVVAQERPQVFGVALGESVDHHLEGYLRALVEALAFETAVGQLDLREALFKWRAAGFRRFARALGVPFGTAIRQGNDLVFARLFAAAFAERIILGRILVPLALAEDTAQPQHQKHCDGRQ